MLLFYLFFSIPNHPGGRKEGRGKDDEGRIGTLKKKNQTKIKKDPQHVVSLKSALYYPGASPSAFGGHPRRTWRL